MPKEFRDGLANEGKNLVLIKTNYLDN